jgi:hypothetical protein
MTSSMDCMAALPARRAPRPRSGERKLLPHAHTEHNLPCDPDFFADFIGANLALERAEL